MQINKPFKALTMAVTVLGTWIQLQKCHIGLADIGLMV